jgi:hypothetical protein
MTEIETTLYFGAEIARMRIAVRGGLKGLGEYETCGPVVKKLFHCGYASADCWLSSGHIARLSEEALWGESLKKHDALVRIGFTEPKEDFWCRGWDSRIADFLSMKEPPKCTT